ncbi:MAG: DeoR/GlpR transcriptional regulator [Clostridiales bacterium]|nr:DeoR/GlpR transcriptional regulator [Clostridiales bacterium]
MRSKRMEDISTYIYEQKMVTLDKLCQKFGVSKNTIRRDINELITYGNFKKIYGGVTVSPIKKLVSFDEREVRKWSAKQRISAKAAELVEDGDIIFIDSGTTTSHMIDHIKDRKNLTVITNNLEIIIRAIPYENINLISLSGTLNRKTLSFTGGSAVNVLCGYNISKAFIAATGISVISGASNSSAPEYEIKLTAVQRSRLVYLLADCSKFNVISLMTYCTLAEIDTLITDEEPPAEFAEIFAENRHNILVTSETR